MWTSKEINWVIMLARDSENGNKRNIKYHIQIFAPKFKNERSQCSDFNSKLTGM